jgi:transposase
MSKAYSQDLRERVIKSYKEGMPKEDIVKLFRIGISTLNRWIKEYQRSGSIEAKKRTKYRKRKIEDEALKEYVAAHPSATLEEMGRYFKVSGVSIWYRLKKLGITRKKKKNLYEERDEKKREEFSSMKKAKRETRVVFIDESGIKKSKTNTEEPRVA